MPPNQGIRRATQLAATTGVVLFSLVLLLTLTLTGGGNPSSAHAQGETVTGTATNTPLDTPTNTPTNTPIIPTDTPTNTPTNTPIIPTDTPTNTATNTPPIPTDTPTNTATNTPLIPTDTPTNTPTNTPVIPTDTPTNTPTEIASATATGTFTATSTATPTNTPSMSCCERNIMLKQPQKINLATSRANAAGVATVTIKVPLDLQWHCNKLAQRDCVVFYRTTLIRSSWEQFVGGAWVIVPAGAIVNETVTGAPPLVNPCDGKQHKGQWSFTYQAVINTGNQLRNRNLQIDLDFPAGLQNKGKEYTAQTEYHEGTTPSTIKIDPQKQK